MKYTNNQKVKEEERNKEKSIQQGPIWRLWKLPS